MKDPNFLNLSSTINLVMTINLNTTTNNTNGFSYFSYLRKSTGELNYYVNDDFGMSIYNSNWSFIKHLNTETPTNGQMIILNNYIYISGDSTRYFIMLNASNLDLVVNSTIMYTLGQNISQTASNGIFWNPIGAYIMTTILTSEPEIWGYNYLNLNKTLALKVSDTIDFNENPTAFYFFKKNYYIGFESGLIYIINPSTQNYTSFQGCPDTPVNSIQLDIYGNMLITCLDSENFYFLDTNGRFLRNFSTTTNAKLTYAGIDQTGRVVAIAMNLKKIFMFF